MKNLIKRITKVATVSLVALTLLIGSVGSVVADHAGYDICASCFGSKATKRFMEQLSSDILHIKEDIGEVRSILEALNGPDLVVVEDAVQFCDRVGDDLRVTVKNAGNLSVSDAPSMVTTVFFNTNVGTLSVENSITSMPISVNDTREQLFLIPDACFSAGDCTFTIVVDSGDDVREINESNNSEDGKCIG